MCYFTTEHVHFRHRLLQVTTEDRGCNIFSGSSCTRFPLQHRFLQVYHTGSCRLPQRTEAATSSQAAAAPSFRYHTGSCRFTTQALAGYHTGSCRLPQRTEAATSSQAIAAPGFHYHTGSCRLPHRLLQVTTEDRGCNIFSGNSCTKFPLPHRFLQVSTQAFAGYYREQRLQHLLRQQLHEVSATTQALAGYHTGSCRLPQRT
jgi:hypothetical protein